MIRGLVTIEDRSAEFPVIAIGNDWSRAYYDGPFYLFKQPDHLPAVSLVFVESRDGNTGADNPADLGGGPTDKYVIYEGLSRVAADGVMAGASTIGRSVFFTITLPELVALRRGWACLDTRRRSSRRRPATSICRRGCSRHPMSRCFCSDDLGDRRGVSRTRRGTRVLSGLSSG